MQRDIDMPRGRREHDIGYLRLDEVEALLAATLMTNSAGSSECSTSRRS